MKYTKMTKRYWQKYTQMTKRIGFQWGFSHFGMYDKPL